MASRFPPAVSPPRMNDGRTKSSAPKGYNRDLADNEDEEGQIMSLRTFEALRKETLGDTISQAGSEEDEVIPVDAPVERDFGAGSGGGAQQQQQQQEVGSPEKGGGENFEVDELQLLLADTPLRKLRAKSKEADKLSRAEDLWGSLRLRQEVLALARMYFGPYRGGERNRHPMLLANSHFRLAKSYADLQCVPQTAEHCSRAIESLPLHGHYHEKVAVFKREVNILLGETLLLSDPPKPQIALQHFQAAADVSSAEESEDVAMQVLVAQCHALMGDSKLADAKATKEACAALEARLSALKAKLEGLVPQSPERSGLMQKIEDTNNELAEEAGFESRLLDEARDKLDLAVDTLMNVNAHEADRLREIFPEKYKQHPLLASLFRRSSEMLLKLAMIEGLRGETQLGLGHIENVMLIQRDYNFLPLGLVARALKEQGAVFVVLRKYEEALKAYNELMALQQERYPDDAAKLGVSQAEAFKLIGNVYVAKKFYRRALEHYDQALKLFSKYLGSRNGMVLDLEHRINEIRASYMDEA